MFLLLWFLDCSWSTTYIRTCSSFQWVVVIVASIAAGVGKVAG